MTKKILLADDSITIRKVVGIIFATEDYQVLMADNGDDALSMAQTEEPDLVIADISMPGKDGFELCRAIKSSSQFVGKTAVMLLPGAFDHFDEDKAGEVCADGWLTKPFESQALLDKVAQLLESTPLAMPGIDVSAGGGAGVSLDASEDIDFSGADFAETEVAASESVDEAAADDIWESVSFDDDLGGDLATETESSESFAADVFADDTESDEFVADFASETSSDTDGLEAESDLVFAEESFAEEGVDNFGVSSSAAGDDTFEVSADTFDAGTIETFGEVEFSPADADADADADSVDFSAYEEETTEESDFMVATVEDEVLEEQSLDLLQEGAEEDALVLDDEIVEDSTLELESAGLEEAPFNLAEGDEASELLDLESEDTGVVSRALEADDFSPLEEDAAPSEPLALEPESSDEDEILDLSEDEILEEVETVDIEVFEPVETQDADIVDLGEEGMATVPVFDSAADEPVVDEVAFDEPVDSDFPVEADQGEDEFEVVEDAVTFDADQAIAVSAEVPETEGEEDAVASAAVEFEGTAAGSAVVTDEPVAVSASAQIEQQLEALSEDDLKEVVAKVAGPLLEKMAAEMVEKIVWEVVPDLAEVMIREEIRKITDVSE